MATLTDVLPILFVAIIAVGFHYGVHKIDEGKLFRDMDYLTSRCASVCARMCIKGLCTEPFHANHLLVMKLD